MRREIERGLLDRAIKYLLLITVILPTVWGLALLVTGESVPRPIAIELDKRLAVHYKDFDEVVSACMNGTSAGSIREGLEPKRTKTQCEISALSRLSTSTQRRLVAASRNEVVAMHLPVFLGAWIIGTLMAGRDWIASAFDVIFPAVSSRRRLYSQRLLGVVTIAGAGAVLLAGLIFLWSFVAVFRGSTTIGIDASWVRGASLDTGRLLLVAILGGGAGFGLANTTKSAIASLIAAVAMVAITFSFPTYMPFFPVGAAVGFLETSTGEAGFFQSTTISAFLLLGWCLPLTGAGLYVFGLRR